MFRRKKKQKQFPDNDLALIKTMPRVTVGGGMTLPSGLKTTEEVITLTDDFRENVRLMWSIVDLSTIPS